MSKGLTQCFFELVVHMTFKLHIKYVTNCKLIELISIPQRFVKLVVDMISLHVRKILLKQFKLSEVSCVCVCLYIYTYNMLHNHPKCVT